MKLAYFAALSLALASFSLEAVSWSAPFSGLFSRKQTQEVKGTEVRALIVYDAPGVVFEVKGKYHLYDPVTGSHVSTRFIGKRKWLQPLKDGLKWGEEFPGQHQLLVVPDNADVTTTVDGIEYRGSLYIYDVEGKLSIVNAIDLEDFLAATLFPRVTGKEPEEYLAAIAIAERTRLYALLRNPKTAYWQVDARDKAYYPGAIATRQRGPLKETLKTTQGMGLVRLNSEGEYVPFSAAWDSVDAEISTDEAKKLAESGNHAVYILERAFPGAFMRVFNPS